MRHSSRGMRHRGAVSGAPRTSRLFTGVAAAFLVGGVATAGVGLSSEAASNAVAYRGDVEPSAAPAAAAPIREEATAQAQTPAPPDTSPGTSPGAAEPSSVPAPAAAPVPSATPGKDATATSVLGPVLPPSAPVTLDIGIIGVSSALMDLGLEADGTVSVPPGDADSPAGWYKNSPTPGELGSSVILGHVNSTQTGVGVFYRLHELTDTDQVSVTRADGTIAVFQVYRVDTYDKASFPSVEVYGQADRAELRLITCGGFDPSTGEFNQNVVAYAHLISSHRG